jgi:peroxiredoxin
MRKLLFIAILILCQASLTAQQKKFILIGEIDTLKNGKIELFITYYLNGRKYKSFKGLIKQGRFKLSGNLHEPAEAFVVINDSVSSSSFYIEPSIQKTKIKLRDIKNQIIVLGSKTNEEYLTQYIPLMKQHKDSVDNWYENMEELEKLYEQNLPVVVKDSMQVVFNNIRLQKDTTVADYNIKFPGSFVGLWSLINRVYDYGYKKIYEETYLKSAPYYKGSKTLDAANSLLRQAKSSSVGALFPHVTANDLIDQVRSTHDFISAGKVTLVDFWFSNCQPCLRQFSELKKMFLFYNQKGFNIISISVDKEKEIWKKAIKENHLIWPQYIDKDKKTASKLLVHFYPSNFLIDKTGKIIAKNLEPFEVEKYLQENL